MTPDADRPPAHTDRVLKLRHGTWLRSVSQAENIAATGFRDRLHKTYF